MTQQDVLELLIASGFGAIVAALIAGLFQRRKMSGDYINSLASAAHVLVDPLSKRLTDTEAELRNQKSAHELEVKSLHLEIAEARRALQGAVDDCENRTTLLTRRLAAAEDEVIRLKHRLNNRPRRRDDDAAPR